MSQTTARNSVSGVLRNTFSLLPVALLVISTIWAPVVHARKLQGDKPSACCVFLKNNSNSYELICDNQDIPGSKPFPSGSKFYSSNLNANSAGCTGRVPKSMSDYQLPKSSTILRSTPNGELCANKFSGFHQYIGSDGSFSVNCWK